MAKSTKSVNVTFGSLQLHEEFTVTGADGVIYSKVTGKRALVVAGGQTHVGRNFELGSIVFPTGTKAGSPSVADKVPSAGRFPPATLTVAASETPAPEKVETAPTKSPEPAPAGVEVATEKVPAPVGATAAPAKKPAKAKKETKPAPAPAKGGKAKGATKAAKTESNGAAKASRGPSGPRIAVEHGGYTLGKGHVLYLRALSGGPLTRKAAWEATELKDPSTSSVFLGRSDPETRAADEAKWGYTSLLTMGFVAVETHQGGDSGTKRIDLFKLTAAGRKALAVAEKALGS